MPRAPKQCGAPDCSERATRGEPYCKTHQAEAQAKMDARRGNFRQRGYDSQHDIAAVLAKQAAVATRALCPRCGLPMLPGQPLDYGHRIARANGGQRASRVEHSHCNRSAQHLKD